MSQLSEITGTVPTPHTPSQDAFPSELSGLPNFNPAMIDGWLADELCRSGLISNPLEFLQEINAQQTKIVNSNKNNQNSSASSSAACLASPPDSILSDSGSSQVFSPVSSYSSAQKPPQISLFPDIHPKGSPVVATPPAQNAGLASLPRIAPRPSTLVHTEVPPIPRPTKRRHETPKDNEELMLKRQKNTDAARRSRLKKLVKMESLEKRVSELESENNQLNTRIAVLESEKSNLESKDKSLEERIRTLEAQLTEAHRALTRAH